MGAPRRIRVAAVQVASANGRVEANLARAEALVGDAASRGAELVLCPEFLAAGYTYDVSIWKSGERRDGPTETWLQRLARHHKIFIGASYLEADREDFFNTFTLAGPDGRVVGRVRKESLPAFEGWFFKSCSGPKTIDTELGRIAVGICNDGHTARFMSRVSSERPDLFLLPHSAPCVRLGRRTMHDCLSEIGAFYASSFGVPAIMVNKVATRSESPVPGVRGFRMTFDFPGLSSIVDGDGRVLERASENEGAIVQEVSLDPAKKRTPAPPKGHWSRAPEPMPRSLGALFVVLERLGARAYGRSRSRRRAAAAVNAQA
jgi:N-carbamoylputrescine amidase